ncbi:MAG: 23S rRNA (adenine(2503)-C(2))-methyltransferase RlmN [Firmicutes bacterium]|nr:23S rRNA (adenine(2503)-C(2))-methyltransferase RlmN [Bacillota bacterium]
MCSALARINLLALNADEVKGFLTRFGEPAFRANQLLDWIWRKNAATFAEMSNLPLALRRQLAEVAVIGTMKLLRAQESKDGTIKLLFALQDGHTVETVILPYEIGDSVCLSTQVGCKMGCAFCASGMPGFIRNLAQEEIMEQVLAARRIEQARGRRLKNMVLMGSGEPLDNWDEVLAFLEAVNDSQRLGMSLRHVTLSTAGLVPKILELAQKKLPLNLAISLHAADNDLRSRLLPVNKKYPLKELVAACDQYTALTGRRVTYEYILLDRINDRPEDARRLAELLRGKLCHVNLIPLNPVAELPYRPSPPERVKTFAAFLGEAGLNVTVRRRLGSDIAAACGQLRNLFCGDPNEG